MKKALLAVAIAVMAVAFGLFGCATTGNNGSWTSLNASAGTIVIIGGKGGDMLELKFLQESFPGSVAIVPNRLWPLSFAAEDVLRQLKEKGAALEELVLVGHSWGGLIAREIDAENPGLVNRIVTIATPNGGFWFAPWFVCGVNDQKSTTPIYVIAGQTDGKKKWYLNEQNDGIIDVSSVLAVERAKAFKIFPLGHVELIHSEKVAQQIRLWLGQE